MMLIWSIFVFLITITLIIVVHEWGHFLIARLFGIKVLRFSIGFGKPLLSYLNKTGTEFVVAAIPLGGYVKMLDEREAPVASSDLPYAFNRKPIWIRTLVVMAGPVFNLFFAFFACWLVFMIGTSTIVPKIGKVTPDSIAASAGVKAGTIIKAIDNHSVKDWRDVLLRLTETINSKGHIALTAYSPQNKNTQTVLLSKQDWQINNTHTDPLSSLGIEPYIPPIPLIIFRVVPNSPAKRAGLQAKDKIVTLAGEKIANWHAMQAVLLEHINQTIPIEVMREGKLHPLTITPTAKRVRHKTIGYLGVELQAVPYPKELIHQIRYNPLSAVIPAFQQTFFISTLTVKLLIKLLSGQISAQTISGPIGIAEGAGVAASLGVTSYLDFIALLSISIGILNILPIPLLDGGHLLYFLIEAVTGRPVSEKIQEIGLRIGIFILLSLTFFAFCNDLSRIFT